MPVLSWLILKGHCRTCAAPISFLYPFIELLTACIMLLLFHQVQPVYYLPYFLFFSLLIVSIRTDLEAMLISRLVTLLAVPLGLLCAGLGYLPITLNQSMLGCLIGYGIPWLLAKSFKMLTGKDGLGAGDLDLLAFTGSFIGPLGFWATLAIGSWAATIVGILGIVTGFMDRNARFPFAPFLIFGAMLYTLYQPQINHLLFSPLI